MRHHQQGISYWGVVVAASVFAFAIKIGTVVGPIYMDYMTIDKMLIAMFKEPQIDELSTDKFKEGLANRMQINNFRDKKVDDLMKISRDGKKLIIDLEYEERKNLVANLDVVVHFKKTYTSERPEGISQ